MSLIGRSPWIQNSGDAASSAVPQRAVVRGPSDANTCAAATMATAPAITDSSPSVSASAVARGIADSSHVTGEYTTRASAM